MIIFDNPAFDKHDPGWGHPERIERLQAIRAAYGTRWEVLPGREAIVEELERVHSSYYVSEVLSTRGIATSLDPDTMTSPGSVEAALIAAGSSIEASELLKAGVNSYISCRPPGHHATPTRAMGFCIFNNAALAAANLVSQGYKVLIFDPDVHHGNGTQEAFYSTPEVLYVSLHRAPFYPFTGGSHEIGAGRGAGTTLNVPLPGAVGDGFYLGAMKKLILPAIDAFEPDYCIISAGFDAMVHDLLGGMLMTPELMAWMTAVLVERFPTMAVLEGGYNVNRLGEDVLMFLEALDGVAFDAPDVDVPPSWTAMLRDWDHPLA